MNRIQLGLLFAVAVAVRGHASITLNPAQLTGQALDSISAYPSDSTTSVTQTSPQPPFTLFAFDVVNENVKTIPVLSVSASDAQADVTLENSFTLPNDPPSSYYFQPVADSSLTLDFKIDVPTEFQISGLCPATGQVGASFYDRATGSYIDITDAQLFSSSYTGTPYSGTIANSGTLSAGEYVFTAWVDSGPSYGYGQNVSGYGKVNLALDQAGVVPEPSQYGMLGGLACLAASMSSGHLRRGLRALNSRFARQHHAAPGC